VLAAEVLAALAPAPGTVMVDGTLGGAGHTRLLLAAGAAVYGIDQDPYALHRARAAALPGLHVLEGNYRDMAALLAAQGVSQVDGVLLDIGVSSFQLDDGERGFSYHTEAPLDMRMSQSGESAADVVNTYEEAELASIIYEYGEDRLSRRIARGIVYAREKAPIETTVALADIVKRAYPGFSKGIHPARRTFQALRIHVNDELGALRDGLQAAETLLRPGGRLAVISFHSLEDRIVKRFLLGSAALRPLSKRPEVASEDEQATNPRARSAKLRSAEKLADAAQGGTA
jgi:16S rRNA (cytosine1402-N4)-methyltransferase